MPGNLYQWFANIYPHCPLGKAVCCPFERPPRETAVAQLSLALPYLVGTAQAQQKPMWVFMLADNVGYGDLDPARG
jgi:hypothetical protein